MRSGFRKSSWKCTDDRSFSVGAGLMGSGGTFSFQDPSGTPVTFGYSAGGAALGGGIKLPKIIKLDIAASGPALFEVGQVYILDNYGSAELVAESFRGVCLIVEGDAFVASTTMMYFGISPARFATYVATAFSNVFSSPKTLPPLVQLANGFLTSASLGGTISFSAGVSDQVGMLW